MTGDRIFGLVVLFVALGYIASATQIQTSFLADPVGPKAFPILVGAVALISALVLMIRPDPEADWPGLATLGAIAVAVAVLVGYAYSLRPLGFVVPTAIAAAVLSYQISPKAVPAILTGTGLSVVLFVLFKYAFGLGLVPFPKGLFG